MIIKKKPRTVAYENFKNDGKKWQKKNNAIKINIRRINISENKYV